MSFEICASGFNANVNGTYSMVSTDHWTNGTYYLWHDPWYWYISISEHQFRDEYSVARKTYEDGTEYVKPTGNYEGLYGNPNGVIVDGNC